ncbi:unnamed protein product [Angiostrongylus costaricensis]|uniref:Histone acetyltransferase n=1 Tax=Angiostrongylus costaricensis TaxID=334426 RepID=A0A0R3PI94_ANGCS|nr:unnamed protein product [Angiostrongylus costaricensis]
MDVVNASSRTAHSTPLRASLQEANTPEQQILHSHRPLDQHRESGAKSTRVSGGDRLWAPTSMAQANPRALQRFNRQQSSGNHGSAVGTPLVEVEAVDTDHVFGPISCSTSVSSSNGLPWNAAKSGHETKRPVDHQVEYPPSNSSRKTKATAKVLHSTTPARKEIVKRDSTPPPVEDTIFNGKLLRHYLRPMWEQIKWTKEAVPFRMPVDPNLPGFRNYNRIIEHPMHFLALKLGNELYKNASEFCDDMWLMVDNASIYNAKKSKVYEDCTKVNISPSGGSRTVKSCCGVANAYDVTDIEYEHTSQYDETGSKRYTACLGCFEDLPPDGISLSESPNSQSNMAPNDKFVQMKNNDLLTFSRLLMDRSRG